MKRIVNFAQRLSAMGTLCAALAVTSPSQTFTTLFSFDFTDGNSPWSGLVQAINGNLYGTTYYGGSYLGGTVFEITPSGEFNVLYNFCAEGYPCPDGASPAAALTQAANGDLYGTTFYGGASDEGTVFKITPGGTLSTLYSFCAELPPNCPDGASPYAGLLQAADGDFYGTNSSAGAGTYGVVHGGTVFKITPSGALTTLYSFCTQSDCTDGAYPYGTLVQAADRQIYGTTTGGGTYNSGTVFKITPSGTLTTLYSFCAQSGCADGSNPHAGLVHGSGGFLYGTTTAGGTYNRGTVFKISPSGTLTTLHSFCARSQCADGADPNAPLVLATDGNFYGTTEYGGAQGFDHGGTLFKITSSGTLTTLHSFCAQSHCADGYEPFAPLIQATNGDLYGTTAVGGAFYGIEDCFTEIGCGTVFSLSVGLGPFAETLPTSGAVGLAVRILGSDLTGATRVTFNGTPATFTVVSPSLIATIVPTGATTGTVQVVTPGGTLSSNVPFRVP